MKKKITVEIMREVAIIAAKKAGEILLSNFGQKNVTKYKSAEKYAKNPQVISNVDIEVEKSIVDVIQQKYPNHGFLAEESQKSETASEFIWIIDGLDGTTQYTRQLPYYSISIALQHLDQIVLGIVYAPHLGELFAAEKDKGAFLNDEPIHVSDVVDASNALIASSTFGSYKVSGREDVFSKLLDSFGNLRIFGSPAIDLCYVASGRLDGRVTANTEPWDHSAGCLIIEEAGGQVIGWDGSLWSPNSSNLLATNGHMMNRFLSIVNDS